MWSSNGYDGQTYEFKVNCFGEFDVLEACLLFDVTRVTVVGPSGTEFELDKDFNINAYSGEVTRRWVLYGPPGHGLPKPGQYNFTYFQGGESVLEQIVDYTPEVVDFPREVSWQREGSDLVVSWTPPVGAKPGMWYKVLVFPEAGELISLQFDWDVSEARLQDIPLKEGDVADVNVSVFFHGGYAYSDHIPLRWEVVQTSQGDDRLSQIEASAPPMDLFLPFRVGDVRGDDGFISPFGIIRHSRDAGHGHGGIDVPLSESAPVYAVADGIILSAERPSDNAGGFDVTLLIQGANGEGWGFLYEHIVLKSGIAVGDLVSKGQLIATNGLTTDRRNNHFQLAYMFNGYMFSRDHRCWKDHLDPSSTETLRGYFDSVRASEEFITQWETAIEEGSKAYMELLNGDRFPEGPQLCYPLGLDVRMPG
ncbi:MAG: M23 family metallopeptidase [Chloroflexi bacterium]|nr:M23 family metallopeptidase [Chloroflexota bacterium]